MSTKVAKSNRVVCSECGREIAEYQQQKHYGTKSCKTRRELRSLLVDELNCIHCSKLCKNLNSLRQHEVRCKFNGKRIELTSLYAARANRTKGGNQYTKAKSLGLPKPVRTPETIERTLATRVANGTLYHSDKTKKKISESMKAAVRRNPDAYSSYNVCGRVKIQHYNGQKFHGMWEVLVAKHFDFMHVEWVRNANSFEYEYLDKQRLYFPDFYLPQHDMYVEIKGYEVEKDRYKWNVVTNLIVLKLNDINEIKKNNICTKLKNNLIY
jgi:hypothetical protein